MDEVRVKNFGATQNDMFIGSVKSFNKTHGSDPEAEVPTASESVRINGPIQWLYGPFTATRQFSDKYNKNIYIFTVHWGTIVVWIAQCTVATGECARAFQPIRPPKSKQEVLKYIPTTILKT